MKTKIFTAFSLLMILLASCAFNEKSSGKSSLSFSIPQETLVKIAEKRHVISPSLNYTPPVSTKTRSTIKPKKLKL